MLNLNISKVKLIVTCPAGNFTEIREVLGNAGAGVIGNYTHCSISHDCIGSFKGNNSSNPHTGEKNKLEVISEVKLEMQCDIDKVKHVLSELRKTHPYKEPAIDIVPLLNEEDL